MFSDPRFNPLTSWPCVLTPGLTLSGWPYALTPDLTLSLADPVFWIWLKPLTGWPCALTLGFTLTLGDHVHSPQAQKTGRCEVKNSTIMSGNNNKVFFFWTHSNRTKLKISSDSQDTCLPRMLVNTRSVWTDLTCTAFYNKYTASCSTLWHFQWLFHHIPTADHQPVLSYVLY